MPRRLLFVTDLHGSRWKYDRLLPAAQAFQADVVINSGDMLPKGGDLPSTSSGHRFAQGRFITDYLDTHFAQFTAAGIYYLCYLCNDDLRIFDERFEKTCDKYPFVIPLAQRKFEMGGIEFVGFNWVVDYPFRLKDRCRMDTQDYVFQPQFGTGLLSTPNDWQEIKDWFAYARTLPTIAEELNRLVRPKNMARSIYVVHMPPYQLGLDHCSDGQQVGSKAIYNFLLEHQPKLSLHGHIHESPEVSGRWYTRLGDTLCIQPGQLTSFTYVTIDLSIIQIDRHIEPYQP
jgi:Icc-related predicted phosphoesterase